jgi:hypothetical protein
MPFDVKILGDKIAKIKEAFENGAFADALVAALNTGNGLLQQRVFTQNKDVEGQDFGQYVGKKRIVKALPKTSNRTQRKRNKNTEGQELTYYQRKRALRGRQTARKDLELEGSLRRSIETQVEDERAAVINFSNTESALIAHGQEQQITNIRNGRPGTTKGTGATKIFNLDTKEREEVTEQGAELIKEILKPK